MTSRRLSSSIRFQLIYQDETQFGSAVTGKCDTNIRRYCASITAHRKRSGLADVVAHSRELLAATMVPGGLADLYARPGVLLEDWLYPDAKAVKPVALQLERNIDESIVILELSPDLLADLALYLGEWQQGSTEPTTIIARELWNALSDYGALVPVNELCVKPQLGHATFVGHSTLRISDRNSSILFDPFLLPKSEVYPPNYQPLSLEEMGKPDAVFITHSHPDHFDLGTLLRVGANTPIFVPEVQRESVLAIDMAFRLRQLGFNNIQTIRPFEETQIGEMRVIALPFYGEQPTVAEVLHPDIRNQGNTYLVEYCKRRIALTADSGSDCLGNIKQLADIALERYGALDTLFGGYRGFGLYPIQYLFSSVARYLPFVPEKSWQVRQKMMCDADDLIDVAEIWNAKRIVPYSDGGAPWFWQRGLGPCLDGSQAHIMAVDPTPDHVCEVAAQRSGTRKDGIIASPIVISLLRPGDALVFAEEQ
ncbi:putative Zn-dependent hydrolase of beta-lactamase fold protein [Cylindrospermum stagnale PCC 7417]|uniref:Putative Zn-dependent hydrolase of beta-lactamase fold protein n=1 Tax=Cylindrospermum stagnale PCC 7417 TaxID=56107 RepID=K9X487_9NOST|nr:MBL fold metallo-hydrolase [Cylindrospermum stagnale]AFZ26482.1 putative Zn-dependent hydrolase of beta-lactamase fold protein [Cylindrospermum stagnale PCC 7417]